MLDINIHT